MGCKLVKNKVLLNNPKNCPHCGVLFTIVATEQQFKSHVISCQTVFQPQAFRNDQYLQPGIIQTSPQRIPLRAQITQSSSNDLQIRSQIGQNQMVRQSSPIKDLYRQNNRKKYYWSKQLLPNQKFKYHWVKMNISKIQLNTLGGVMSIQINKIKNEDFIMKQFWFRIQLEKLRISWREGSDTIYIKQDSFLKSTLASVYGVNWHKEVKVVIAGEEQSLDAGGLLREWITQTMKEIINPQTKMFVKADTEDITYRINSEALPEDHMLDSFRLLGVVVGKAIFESVPLNVFFDRSVLRHMISQPVIHDDIYFYDKQLYSSWTYLLETQFDPEELIQNFTITKQGKTIELKPHGDDIFVDNSNKREYVRSSIDYYTYDSVKPFLQAFLNQLYTIIPKNLLSIFEPLEIEMILYGIPFIDLQDWKENTEYRGSYTEQHQVVNWFWDLLESIDQPNLGKFLQFCTGSQRTPVEGFRTLQSNRGTYAKFCLESTPFTKANPFPQAHTCFNRLCLPIYETQQDLRTYLKAIIENDLDGVFGLE